MAKKLLVTNGAGDQQVPFLRGVLVQSLVESGLSFEDAYATAQAVRDQLETAESTTTKALRERVATELERRFGAAVRTAYEAGREQDLPIIVRTPMREVPFSVGFLARYLEGCAVEREQALEGARTVNDVLRKQGRTEIDQLELRRLVFDALSQQSGAPAANRFLSRCRFDDSGEPLILLVGGATGAGKSTVTAELAYLLDIVRTQSTDMMREIIRCYLMPHVAPTLGYSSFEAWRGLPEVVPLEGQTAVADNPVISGFLAQFGTVKVALEATINRAVQERHHLIVDGIHVLPTKLDLAEAYRKAVVVSVVLAVTTIERLAKQLARRSEDQPDRSSSRRIDHLGPIWELQTYMLDQAERGGVRVIANWTLDETVRKILHEVMARISERCPPDPAALEREMPTAVP